ncbi:MAG: PAS domain S-box protein [Bacteroidetes bacterium]|nr:PAS domain S-box protein [Bacteroidota bacterium]
MKAVKPYSLHPQVTELISEKSFSLLCQNDIVSIADTDSLIVFANENFARISGYSVHELEGAPHSIINSGHHPHSFWQTMWNTITRGRSWRAQIKNKTKAGQYYWINTQVTPIKDEHNIIIAYMAVGHDITHEKLEEVKIKAIYNNTKDSHVLLSPTSEILSFNHSAYKFFKKVHGLEMKVGESIHSYLSHEDDIEFELNFKRALAGEEVRIELEFSLRDGRKRWYKIAYAPVYDEFDVLIGVARNCGDIDKRKRAEENLTKEKRRLVALVESIPDAIFFKDGDGRWLITNETAKRLFKLHDIDWYEKTEMELAALHPEFQKAHETCLIDDERTWQSRQLMVFTEFVVDDQGRTREYEVRKMPVFKADGSRKALVIIGTDVTERKLNEAQLKTTKKMMEQIMRVAKIGGWQADFATNTLKWTGLTRELTEVDEDYIPELDTVHLFYKEGESRDKIMAAVEHAKNTGQGFEIELEMVSAKGRTFYTKTIAEPKMVNGVCEKIYGYFQDITEQVELSRKNKQIEIKFSHLIEKSADAIILQDERGIVQFFSAAARKILGYTSEEIVGQNLSMIFHPDDVQVAMQNRKTIRETPGGSFPITVNRVKHKQGHYLFVEGTVTNLIHDENVKAIVVNFRDVTEKKATAEKLTEKNKNLETIAFLFSHEVRGPVATISGLSNIFNREDATDPINKAVLDKIQIPVHRLDEIISKIVQMTNELDMTAARDEKSFLSDRQRKIM